MSESDQGNLSGINLLSSLTDEERGDLEQQCRWRYYSTQEQIIDRQSDTADVFFVVDGQVRIVNYSLSGREITFDEIPSGGHFGELAAIDGAPRSAGVMAMVNSHIASISQDRFKGLLEQNPSMALQLMEHLASMVRMSTERIMDLSTLAANNRVHAEILRQGRTSMDGENSARISPIPVHGDIASRVSTTRETVARVLNDLARQGVVERHKNALVIGDIDRLIEMVEEVRGE